MTGRLKLPCCADQMWDEKCSIAKSSRRLLCTPLVVVGTLHVLLFAGSDHACGPLPLQMHVVQTGPEAWACFLVVSSAIDGQRAGGCSLMNFTHVCVLCVAYNVANSVFANVT